MNVIQVNTHLTPRPILLTRHGESRDNVRGRIGGDSVLRLLSLNFLLCFDDIPVQLESSLLQTLFFP